MIQFNDESEMFDQIAIYRIVMTIIRGGTVFVSFFN